MADTLFELQPQASLAHAIRAELPDDGILVNDVTQISFFASLGYPVYEPRTLIGPGYQGTLGCGFATALGAQAGNPDKKVVCVSGDGGFMYNVQELSTMKHYNIPLVAIVFNDNAFGNVKRIQKENYRGRTIVSDLTNPDFVALANSFGIAGMRASGADALQGTLREALATNRARPDRSARRRDAQPVAPADADALIGDRDTHGILLVRRSVTWYVN